MDGREFERDSRAPSKKEVRATRMKGIIVPLYACAECLARRSSPYQVHFIVTVELRV